MAERVTRQFADVPTGEPVIGGLFRLVNKTDPTDLPHEMLETTDPQYPGRYYTADGDSLSPGIYAVERNSGSGYAPTGEEVSVSPHRVYAGDISVDNSNLTQVGLVLGDTVRASAFVPEDTDAGVGLLQYLQSAVNYAAGAGLRKVYVGAWRGRSRWEGANQLNLTGIENIDLDLGGAEIARAGNLTPIAMAGGVIHSGSIAHPGAALPAISVLNRNYHPVFRDIQFTGENQAATTMFGVDWVRCRYKNCEGQILFTEPYCQPVGPAVSGRTQESDKTCMMASGEVYVPVDESNTPGYEIGAFFGVLCRSTLTDDPADTAMPFGSGEVAGQALAHMYFERMPQLDILRARTMAAVRTVSLGSPACYLVPWYGIVGSSGFVYMLSEGAEVTSVGGTISIPGEVIEREYVPASDTKFRTIKIRRVIEFPKNFTTGANDTNPWTPKTIDIPIPVIGADLDGVAVSLPAICHGKATIMRKIIGDTGYDSLEIPAIATFDGVNNRMIFNFGVGPKGYGNNSDYLLSPRPMLSETPDSQTVIIVEADIPNARRVDLPRLL